MVVARACDRIGATVRDRASRLRVLLYLLVGLTEALQIGIAPLLPAYARRFGLSGVETGMLLAATSAATLAVSIPAGGLADRFGARRVTLAAAWIVTASTLAQAVAPSFALLIAARLAFGLAFGIIWTTALVWLSAVARPDSAASAVGATVTSAGVGIVVGPVLVGLAAERLGLAAPFLIAAGLAAAVSVLLSSVGAGRAPAAARSRVGPRLRAALREPDVRGAVTAIVVAGLASSLVALLVPLELSADGASAGAIGLAFSAAAGLYIAGSAAVVALGSRAVSRRTVFAVALALALAFSPAAASGSPGAVVVAMCLTAGLRAALWTVAMPLGVACAGRRDLGEGTVLGLLNGVWAAMTLAGPLVAGALAGAVGARLTYATVEVAMAAGLAIGWLRLRRRAAPVPAS